MKSTQGATVRRMAESLDVVAATILLQTVGMEQLSHPRVTTVEETLATTQSVSAIARLLELGLIIATWGPVDSTDVVAVVMRHGVAEMLRTSANYRPTRKRIERNLSMKSWVVTRETKAWSERP